MMNHSASQRSFVWLIIASILLLTLSVAAFAAPSMTLGYQGDGIYPRNATANSQRWIRVTLRWDRSTVTVSNVNYDRERITGLRLVNHDGGMVTFNPSDADGTLPETYASALDSGERLKKFFSAGRGGNTLAATYGSTSDRAQFGVHIEDNSTSSQGNLEITIGPFSHYEWENLVGRIPVTSTSGAGLRFLASWDEISTSGDTAGTYLSRTGVYSPVIHHITTRLPIPAPSYGTSVLWQSGENQAWFSGDGTGLDPLEVTRSTSGSTHNTDDGSSSDRFTFRTRYFSGRAGWPELRVQWRQPHDPGDPRRGGRHIDFDRYVYHLHDAGVHDHSTTHKRVRWDYSEYEWLYGQRHDLHYDLIGDGSVGSYDPEAILIIDRDYDNPHYMMREQGTYPTGMDFRYDLMPTNYLQLLNNIFTFSYDIVGPDAWDTFASNIRGLPTSNAYVAMRGGGHTYEFLTTRDYRPAVATISAEQGGTKIGPRAVALRGRPGNELQAIHIVRDIHGDGQRYTEPVHTWSDDRLAGGFGYAFDSQDFTKNPEVNPVLSAYPFFGTTADDLTFASPYNPVNAEIGHPTPWRSLGAFDGVVPGSLPNPFDASGAGLPWGPLTGPSDGSQGPRRFTNQDTIWPNFVNIYREDEATPFRGGKWTEDTPFVFRINYWQSKNFAPQFIQVNIQKVDQSGNPVGLVQTHTMSRANPGDPNPNFREGVVYYAQLGGTELGGPGDYRYWFRAGDGKGTAIFPNRPDRNDIPAGWRPPNDPGQIGVEPGANDYYWFRVNHKPELTNEEVSPASAPSGSNFTYRVTYSDQDGRTLDPNHLGDPPYKSLVHIDYSGDANVATIEGIAGNQISYSAPKAYADHTLRYMQVRRAPAFAPNSNWVIEANALTDATTGTITVGNTDGLAIGQTFRIWFTAVMDPVEPVGPNTDYKAGVRYEYNTARSGVQLDVGKHRYYYEFWDNWAFWINWQQYHMNQAAPTPVDYKVEGEKVRHPAAGFIPGPEIIDNTPPHLSRFFFGIDTGAQIASDRVSGATGNTITYTRPDGLPNYTENLAGKFIEIRSGTASRYIYEIAGSTGNQITTTGVAVPDNPASGSPAADGVMSGNRFRIFEGRFLGADGNYYLSYGYNTDAPDGTAATPFHLYVTYTDAENNPPSVLRARVLDGATAVGTYNMVKVTAGDNAYADGVEYRTSTPIYLEPDGGSVARYTIKAQARDGVDWYGSQDGYGQTPGQALFYGPLTAANQIDVPAKGPDIAPNTAPMLGFDVGTGDIQTFIQTNQFTYVDTGTGADLIGTNPIVTVTFGADVYRVESHEPATNTITLAPGSDPAGDGHGAGAAFDAKVVLDPARGLDTDTFTYWIVYTDLDDYGGVRGNPPEFVRVHINGTEFNMVEYDSADRNMTDGKVYSYSTDELPISQNHQYYFTTSDGLDQTRLPATAPQQFAGPIVHVNTAPELADGKVDPTEGGEEVAPDQPTEFVFTVIYTDADNHPPAEVVLNVRNLDQADPEWQQFPMVLDDGDDVPDHLKDGNFMDGQQYTVSAYAYNPGENQIGDGRHEFYFTTQDLHGLSGRDPAAPGSTYSGPTINDPPVAPSEGFDPASPEFATDNVVDNLTIVRTRTPVIAWTGSDDLDPNPTDTADTLRYVVQLSRQKDFSTIARTLESSQGETSVTVAAANQLADKTAYYYRVKTVDDKGAESDWSYGGGDPFQAVTAFYVDTNLPPYWDSPDAAAFTPTGNVYTLTPTLNWPAGADDDDPVSSLRYRVEIDDNPAFNAPAWSSGWLSAGVRSVQVPATVAGDPVLLWGVTYHWRVQVYDGDARSPWTNELEPQVLPAFTTVENTRPTPPTSGFSPAENVNFGETQSRRPTFRFDPGSDAEDAAEVLRYEVQLWDSSDWAGAGNLINEATNDHISLPGDPRVIMTTDSDQLDPGAPGEADPQYFWRVRTIDTGGLKSDWSPTQTFWLNIENEAPWAPESGFEPHDGDWLAAAPGHGGVAMLRWDEGSDPDHRHDPNYFDDQLRYTVELSTQADFSAIPHTLRTDWGVTEIAAPVDLTRGVQWYWRVKTEDRLGAISAPSHSGDPADPVAPSFRINRAPVLSNGHVSPDADGENDVFTFEVTYTDADGHAPANIELIVTPQTPDTGTPIRLTMAEKGDPAYDYQAGEVFEAVVSGVDIQSGEHTFYFEASDGIALASTLLPALAPDTQFDGPLVNDAPYPVTAGFNPALTDPLTVRHTRVPTISWDAASDPNATDPAVSLRYRLEFSRTSPDAAEGFVVADSFTRTTDAGQTSATPRSALTERVWHYRLITIDRYGAESDPSAVHAFEVRLNRDPNAPVPIGEYLPANGSEITNPTPTLEWPDATDPDPTDTPGTLRYEVQLATNTNFTSPIIDLTQGDAATPEGQSYYEIPAGSPLGVGVTYYWRVRTVDRAGAKSQWSTEALGLETPLSFTVVPNRAPTPPTSGFSPTGGVEVGTPRPTLRWDAGSDPDPSDTVETLHYEVQLDDNDDWTDANLFTGTTEHVPGITELTVDAPLAENGQFWWRVRTVDAQGLASSWSAVQMFYVNEFNEPPTAPTSGFSPAEGFKTTRQLPTLRWDPADDPDPLDDETNLTYIVQLARADDFDPVEFSFQSDLGEPSVAATSALGRGVWYWRVRSRDLQDAVSDWSAVQVFEVEGNNTPEPPVDGFSPAAGMPVQSLTPTLRWNEGSDIDPADTPDTLRYEVQVNDSSDWSALPHVFSTSRYTERGVTRVTLDVELTENKQYWWRVRTVDDAGAESDWSATQMFWVNTENDDPEPPTSGFRPRNGEETELQRPPLRWNPGSDPDYPSPDAQQTDSPSTLSYTVQLSTDEQFTTVDYQYQTAQPGQTQLVPTNDLADETTWFWRVRTVDQHGARSEWSLVQFFNVDTGREPPTLTGGAVEPTLGFLRTTYEFSVIYTDPANEAPISDILVHINSTTDDGSLTLVMERDTSAGGTYASGARYAASVRGDNAALGYGGYEHFYAIEGTAVRYPTEEGEAVVGPVVHTLGEIAIEDEFGNTTDIEEGSTIHIEVRDPDKTGRGQITVTATEEQGDTETVVLDETPADSGVFRGQIGMLGAPGTSGDGVLNVVAGPSGNEISVIWADPDEASVGADPVTATATVIDTIAPRAIAEGELTVASGDDGMSAIIDWTAYDEADQPHNQPDVQWYRVWQSDSQFDDVADATEITDPQNRVPAGTQTFTATGLTIGEEYWFAVTVMDEVPNEIRDVVSRPVSTTDREAPYLTNRLPAPAATDVPLSAGTSFRVLDDGVGVDPGSIELRIDGRQVDISPEPIEGVAGGFSVNYAPTDLDWNSTVQVNVDARDLAGNRLREDHRSWTFDTVIDDAGPEIDRFSPADGATGVAVDTAISARIRDAASGVDTASVVMTVNGDEVDGALLDFGDAVPGTTEVTVRYQPEQPLDWMTAYTVTVDADDMQQNSATTAEWTFTTVTEPTFEIRGIVTYEDGEPIAGVEVTADGARATTDGNGAYRLRDLSAGEYEVTPSFADHDFADAPRVVTLGPDATEVNFVASRRTYSISGRVTRGGSGVEGVVVSDGTRTATTDAEGNYTIIGVPSGNYTVTPSRDANEDGMEDFTYTPSSLPVEVSGASVVDVNFRATLVTYSISGTISDSSGNRVSGVTVSDGTRTATTNEAGQFTIGDVPPSTVTITPTRAGRAFDPETIVVTVPPAATAIDFTAYTEFSQRFEAGVHMIGVPASPPSGRDRAVDIFGTDRVARWDPERTPPSYVLGDVSPDASQLQVRPGAGFFVRFPGVTDVTVPGDAISETASFSVGVTPGWNQVGNMYETALPMANISGAGSTQLRPFAFIWDSSVGSYRMISREPAFNSARTFIEAWEGAWIKATGASGTLNISGPANVSAASMLEGAAAASEAPDNGWLLPIVARVGNRADLTTVAGVGSGDASRGYRVENPPMMPGSVDVYFIADGGGRLAHDIRAQNAGSMVWPFAVQTDIADAEVELTLPDLSGVPHDLAVYLTDQDTGRRMYARTLPAYTFTTGADGALRRFELEVAPRGADNLAIRTASVQSTGAGLMVTYDVSSAAHVSIEVLNIAGRSVRKLVESRAVPAGSNEQTWNLRSADGTVVPNGSYLIKIEAVAENGQRVQALRPAQITR